MSKPLDLNKVAEILEQALQEPVLEESSLKERKKKTNFPANKLVIVFRDGSRFEIKVTELEKFLTDKLPNKVCLHVSDLHNVLDQLCDLSRSQLKIDILLSYVGTREMLESTMDKGLQILCQTGGTVLIFCGLKQKLDIPKTVSSTEELLEIVGNLASGIKRIEQGTKGQILEVLASMGYDLTFIDDCRLNAGAAMLAAILAKNKSKFFVTYAHQPKGQSIETSRKAIMDHFRECGAVRSVEPGSEEPDSREPGSEESDSKEPAPKEPDSREPGSEESDSKEPAPKESDSKEPAPKESDSKEPGSEESDSKEPAPKESDSKEPGPKEPVCVTLSVVGSVVEVKIRCS